MSENYLIVSILANLGALYNSSFYSKNISSFSILMK